MNDPRRFLSRRPRLRNGLSALLSALIWVAAGAFWLLPLPVFFLAVLALLAIFGIASWLGVDVDLGVRRKS